MEWLSFFIIIFGFMSLLQSISGLDACEMPIFTFSVIILALYCFGLSGVLPFGLNILIFLGFFGFSSDMLGRLQQKKLPQLLTDPGIVAFLAMTGFIAFKLHSFGYTEFLGDDATYWGVAAKEIYATDSLRTQATDIAPQFQGYTEGLSLFIYFISKITHFDQTTAYIAKNALLFAPVCLFSRFTKKSYISMLTLAFAYFFLISNCDWAHTIVYNNLLTDPIIGAWFGMGILNLIGRKEPSPWRLVFAMTLGCTIYLIKKPGQLFSLLLMSCYAFEYFFALKNKPAFPAPRAWSKFASCLFIALLFACTLLLPRSWSHYLQSEHLHEAFPVSITLDKLKKSLSPETATPTEKCFLKNFTHAFQDRKLKPALAKSGLTILEYLVVCISLGFVFMAMDSKKEFKGQTMRIYTHMVAGLAAYLIGLFFVYLYAFGPNESCNLGGFPRYAAVYIAAFTLVILGSLCQSAQESPRHPLFWAMAILVLTALLAMTTPNHIWYFIFNSHYPQNAL